MSYIGSTPTTQSFIAGTDYFNGDGSTVAFTLSRSVVSVNDIEVVINNVEQQPNTAYTISGTTITFTSAPSSGTSNIYVRYLSTTTQSITPSQNTVSYSTWNSDLQNKTWGFKNRIINGNMVIAQRGTSFSTSNAYTLDRWAQVVASPSAFTITQSSSAPANFTKSLLLTVTTGGAVGSNINYVAQSIEGYNIADLGWGTNYAKTVTLSFWVKSSITGTFGASLRNNNGGGSFRAYPFTYTISSANTWEQKSVTIAGDTSGTWATDNTAGITLFFDFGTVSTYTGTAGVWSSNNYVGATGTQTTLVATNGATWATTGVQLEVGTQATNFDVRDYGRELMMCQRYYFVQASYDFIGGNSTVAPFVLYSSTDARGILTFPVTMRSAPSLVQGSGSGYYSGYGNATGPTDFSSFGGITATTQQGTQLYKQGTSLGIQGGACWINCSVSGAFVAFTAEF